jgi:putative colanic acid biosynthesis acetyltransferase WcaF
MAKVLSNQTDDRPRVNVSRYHNPLSWRNKLARAAWGMVWALLFRTSPGIGFGPAWRRFLLRLFGARIGRGATILPSCRVWTPWNLEMGDSCLSHHVDCCSVHKIKIGSRLTISQYSSLCTASHDLADPYMRLITAPITIGEGAWICAGVLVGPGVNLGEDAVAAARAVVVRDVEPWVVVEGNPAVFIKRRELA